MSENKWGKKGKKQRFFNDKFVICSFRILRLFWVLIVHLHCSLMFFWGRKWYCSSFGLYSYAEMNTMRWCAVGCHCNWVNIGSSCFCLLAAAKLWDSFSFTGRCQCHPSHYHDWQQPSKHWEKGSRSSVVLWLNTTLKPTAGCPCYHIVSHQNCP